MRTQLYRRGFTLIELLVVIAIIAVLIALLVPAVQKVREASARTQCTNNLKQIALACHSYENMFKILPPGWTHDTTGFPNRQSDSMWYHILPFIEQQSVFDRGTRMHPEVSSDGYKHKMAVKEMAESIIPAYLCPADGSNPNHLFNPKNGGQAAVASLSVPELLYSTGAYMGNVFAFDPSAPRSNLRAMPDGSSNTCMIGHRQEVCDPKTVWGVTFVVPNIMFGEPRNFSPYRSMAITGMPTYWKDNGGTGTPDNTNGVNKTTRNVNGVRGFNNDFTVGGLPFQIRPRAEFCQPFSMVTPHDAMIVALGDASVRTVSENISAVNWKNAWTPADGAPMNLD
jgi:prepilin-type N-terminal cleavage/methylation domain-containing protein